MGVEAGICFNALPSHCSFSPGVWASEPSAKKPRAKPQPRVVDTGPEEKPQEQQQGAAQKQQDSTLSFAEANIKKLRKTLKRRANEEKDPSEPLPKIDGRRFLLNPKSFTQTVENMFYYSFLVKKGQGGIGVDEDGLYVHPVVENDEESNDVLPEAKQAIISLTMRDWRRLRQGLTEHDMPHRAVPSPFKKRQSPSQSSP